MTQDQISGMFRKAINVLFVSNPRGTSIGILIGVLLDGLLGLISPMTKLWGWANISAIKIWHLMAGGVVIMNLPTYLTRKKVDPSILNAIDYIEEQKKNRTITGWQASQMYRNLHQKVLESVTLDDRTQATANSLQAVSTEPIDSEKHDK
ncbi:hypothetical protein N0786_00785 [Pseudomonas aeruginosa]|uniref:hypothetical protein n=1 Tax=Pseudomonas aeruginosa TaxID=287 RepID=UPI000F8231A1|nr:hypothetical protein [Pseudomonas aeruginosa]MBU5930502.1 hypothetical protein [Pseudomonas aeruginosa]MCS7668355.1 hypothetical protein [Pseudomonas aeruginosa]MCS9860192.1 hypothetical protein [Pseudomonas aeruginosa]RTW21801.1 hypothetical protein DY999_05775 [Pseudomonas aeruginosa]RUI24156.1 hypothetical protein IPC447_05705 [Pseudomonas aeruginosa]